jgi:excisionase family DNA binding protein
MEQFGGDAERMITRWLSITDAADYAGLSRKTVKRMLDSGALCGDRTPGGHWRIDRESIDAWFGRTEKKAVAVLGSFR